MNIDIKINLKEIKSNFKICNAQKAKTCIILGPDNASWVGKSCPQCYAIERAAYYQKNKAVINGRVTVKRRSKRNALLEKKEVPAKVDDIVDENEI